jgi:hypothetical protein
LLHRSIVIGSLAALAFLSAGVFAQQKLTVEPPPKVDAYIPQLVPQKIEGGYAIVISKSTQDDSAWAKVVDTLKVKYGGQVKVFVWEQSIDETKAGLSEMLPHYTCFVATPKETSREFVAQVHRLTRNLNDDPYPDTIWGILPVWMRPMPFASPRPARRWKFTTLSAPPVCTANGTIRYSLPLMVKKEKSFKRANQPRR